jgi:hypothetical protein
LVDGSGARWNDRFFRQGVGERDDFDEAGLDGSGTVVSQGFEWCGHQLETMTGRGRSKEDRAMRFGGSKGGAEKHVENKVVY